MQNNLLTLAVDTLNDGIAIVDNIYTRFEEFLNRSKYIGENHTLDSRDELSFYRTFPKQAGNYKGVAKSTAKFTVDVVVPGVDGTTMLTKPLIMEIACAVPVGTSPADTVLMRQKGVALLDRDDIMSEMNDLLMV